MSCNDALNLNERRNILPCKGIHSLLSHWPTQWTTSLTNPLTEYGNLRVLLVNRVLPDKTTHALTHSLAHESRGLQSICGTTPPREQSSSGCFTPIGAYYTSILTVSVPVPSCAHQVPHELDLAIMWSGHLQQLANHPHILPVTLQRCSQAFLSSYIDDLLKLWITYPLGM